MAVSLGLSCAASTWTAESENRSLHMGAYVDMGQVVRGSTPTLGGKQVEGLFLPRMGVSLTVEQIIDERLRLRTGVGGLFWYPVDASPGGDHTRTIHFGPGITEASFAYDFSPAVTAKGGFISYKYNPDAVDLGEYLFRSECYPALVYTEGWSWLDNSAAQSLGAQARWTAWDGRWTNDLLLLSDMTEQPKWDFSPALVSTLRVGRALTLGAGISLHRWLPVQPSADRPGDSANTYVEIDGFPALPFIADSTWKNISGPHTPENFAGLSWRQLAFAGGTMKGNLYDIAQYRACATCARVLDSLPLAPRVSRRYTFKGIKLMGRFSLDFRALLGLEGPLGPGELKAFGEAAVLGLENQPFYYDDVTSRIPIMFGLNLPVFRLLDQASLQFEYYRNPWPDSKQKSYKYGQPVWDLERDLYARYVQLREEGLYGRDDWKWSFNVRKTLFPGLRLQAQAANDHFRLRQWNEFDVTYYPLTNRMSHWYYLVRLEWNV
jgi:hypothetical protein